MAMGMARYEKGTLRKHNEKEWGTTCRKNLKGAREKPNH